MKHVCETCTEKPKFSSKQYLREHQHKFHFNTFLYFCRSCGKGFYKHCKLNHHKKSYLAYLLCLMPSTTSTPSSTLSAAPSSTVLVPPGEGMQASQATASGVDLSQDFKFSFSQPKRVDWNNPPNVGGGGDDDDDDEEEEEEENDD